MIWIQVVVVFNIIYICSCYKYLFLARNLPPPPSSVNKAAILVCKEDMSAAEILVIQVLFFTAALKFGNLCQEQEMKILLTWQWFFVRHSEPYKPEMAAGLPQCFLSEQLIKVQRW